MNRALWVFTCVLVGCFSLDDFDPTQPDDPNAPRSCDSRGQCKPANYEVRVCVEGLCLAPPLPEATLSPLPPNLSESQDLRNQGTVIIAGAILAASNSASDTIQIRADNIIIDGTLSADPTRINRVQIWAEQDIWVRGESRLQSQGGRLDPVYFTLQAEGNLYVDQSVILNNNGACTCLFGETLGHSDHLRKDHDCGEPCRPLQ